MPKSEFKLSTVTSRMTKLIICTFLVMAGGTYAVELDIDKQSNIYPSDVTFEGNDTYQLGINYEKVIIKGEASSAKSLSFFLKVPEFDSSKKCGSSQALVPNVWINNHASSYRKNVGNWNTDTSYWVEQVIPVGPGPFEVTVKAGESDGCGWPRGTEPFYMSNPHILQRHRSYIGDWTIKRQIGNSERDATIRFDNHKGADGYYIEQHITNPSSFTIDELSQSKIKIFQRDPNGYTDTCTCTYEDNSTMCRGTHLDSRGNSGMCSLDLRSSDFLPIDDISPQAKWSSSDVSPVFGGTGGNSFTSECLSSEVIGLYGRAGETVYNIGVSCSDGSKGSAHGNGSNNWGQTIDLTCSQGQFISGIKGYSKSYSLKNGQSFKVVGSLSPICRGMIGRELQSDSQEYMGTKTLQADYFAWECPENTRLDKLGGKAGDVVNSVELNCSHFNQWRNNEENTSEYMNCASVNRDDHQWEAEDCQTNQPYACQNLTSPYDWRTTATKGEWEGGHLSCIREFGAGYRFASPYSDTQSTTLNTVLTADTWINFVSYENETKWYEDRLDSTHFVNLLENGNGKTGDLSGWTVTSSSGDGWKVYGQPLASFATSNGWSKREQMVDLYEQGFKASELALQPSIYVTENFTKTYCPDFYYLKVSLLDNDMNLLTSWNSEEQRNSGGCRWDPRDVGFTDALQHQFDAYGEGLRYIKWEDGGKDSENWRGNYGVTIGNGRLFVYRGVQLSSDSTNNTVNDVVEFNDDSPIQSVWLNNQVGNTVNLTISERSRVVAYTSSKDQPIECAASNQLRIFDEGGNLASIGSQGAQREDYSPKYCSVIDTKLDPGKYTIKLIWNNISSTKLTVTFNELEVSTQINQWRASQPDGRDHSSTASGEVRCVLAEGYDNNLWNDVNCGRSLPHACRNPLFPHDWKLTAGTGEWSEGDISCAEEYGYVFSLPNLPAELTPPQGQAYWINYHYDSISSKWDTGSKSFANFKSIQPNQDNNKRCVKMDGEGEWTLENCDVALPFICKADRYFHLIARFDAYKYGTAICENAGYEFVAPFSPDDNFSAKLLLDRNNIESAWINLNVAEHEERRDTDNGPYWGAFRKDSCISNTTREYSSILWGASTYVWFDWRFHWGDGWEDSCRNEPATIDGHFIEKPMRCEEDFWGHYWGKFEVPDSSCAPYWDTIENKGCSGNICQYEARLLNIPTGQDEKISCESMPVVINGLHISRPTECKKTHFHGTHGYWTINRSEWQQYLSNIHLDFDTYQELLQKYKGGEGVVVAVLDSGIGFVNGLEGKKYKEYNFTLDDSGPSNNTRPSIKRHGTAMASLIASNQIEINDKVVVGIAPNAKISSYKYLPNGKNARVLFDAIKTALNDNLTIINISGGMPNETATNYEYARDARDTVNLASEKQALIVAAVGNSSKDISTEPDFRVWPAQSKTKKGYDPVLRVGGSQYINKDPELWESSNFGVSDKRPWVDILAPAEVNQFIIDSDNLTALTGGTSGAAAIVSGVAAVMKGCKPNATGRQLKEAILNNADEYAALKEVVTSGRVLNAKKAIEAFCKADRSGL